MEGDELSVRGPMSRGVVGRRGRKGGILLVRMRNQVLKREVVRKVANRIGFEEMKKNPRDVAGMIRAVDSRAQVTRRLR